MPQQPWRTPVLLDPWRAFFPYPRFFRGDYRANAPIVYDRKAGFRPQENTETYKLPFNTYQPSYTSLYSEDCSQQDPYTNIGMDQGFYSHPSQDLCFATSPGTFYPCKNCGQPKGQCHDSPHLLRHSYHPGL